MDCSVHLRRGFCTIVLHYYTSIIIIQDRWGSTPLMAACWNNHISTAKILVENGAVIDLLNKVIDGSMHEIQIVCSLIVEGGGWRGSGGGMLPGVMHAYYIIIKWDHCISVRYTSIIKLF